MIPVGYLGIRKCSFKHLFSFVISLYAKKIKFLSGTISDYYQKFYKCATFQARMLDSKTATRKIHNFVNGF